jgi:hypothetical protein
MNEHRLRALLRDTEVPDALEAERRGLRVIERAYAERLPARRQPLPRLALALAVAALLGALVLSPAGAAVRHWIGRVFDAGVPNAERSLTDIPGGGRLLVQSAQGPWVVQADGSRRLLGRYREAGWSPHGLFVAATSGRTLSAIEPDGTPHWSISARRRIDDPRWSPSGFRIAYRSGPELRVVDADGEHDKLIDSATAAVPPVWFPSGLHLLAYLTDGGRLQIVDTDTGKRMASTAAAAGVTGLAWSADGSELLQASPHHLWLRRVGIHKLAESLELGPPRAIPLAPGAGVRTAAFSPRGRSVAALLQLPRRAGARSELLLADPPAAPRPLFAVSGQLAGLAWSPDGSRLLVGWPAADQWLFVPVRRHGRIHAVGGIAAAFAPGHPSGSQFPQIVGWCCAPQPGGAG